MSFTLDYMTVMSGLWALVTVLVGINIKMARSMVSSWMTSQNETNKESEKKIEELKIKVALIEQTNIKVEVQLEHIYDDVKDIKEAVKHLHKS